MKQLTFKVVCAQLDKEMKISEKCEDLKVLSGAAIFLLGMTGIIEEIELFFNALTVREELTNMGKHILDKIMSRETNEYDKRMDQMKWAYSMIYYTAFFDTLDEMMPKEIRDSIALTMKEKKDIFKDGILEKNQGETLVFLMPEEEIFFPNVMHSYIDIEEKLKKLYAEMSENVKKFVQLLSFEEVSTEKQIIEFHHVIEKLPACALKRFKSQYLYLANNYNEFYVYMQIEDRKTEEKKIEEKYQNIVSLGFDISNKIDVGLENLSEILRSISGLIHKDEVRSIIQSLNEDKVRSIVQGLIEKYQKEIEKPVLEISEKERREEKIQYPSIREAFIPQSYKMIKYMGNECLEKKETWKKKKTYENMDSFWAKYYVSPYSVENLLLILGEPGGGKSLLTKMLCARMMDEDNVFIRIPLRDVDLEKTIEDIVREQIEEDGDAAEVIPTFKWFAEKFKSNPITLIFDGYDEVQQATGGEYRELLNKILEFQGKCNERHRPVRIVVTSRATLIDKADIPVSTIVMKLLEFNEEQREKWIEIWNQKNNMVFQRENIHPFTLPKDNKSVEELSRQPLLLLMLAIYDADVEEGVNALAQEEILERTQLYNELLRRFIKRELKKGARGNEIPYEEFSEDEKEKMIACEMEKLGIAALGMFIRERLSLYTSELEKDLSDMDIVTPVYESKRAMTMLNKAEVLFDSFFFIHYSKTENKKEAAFEFLHKTFYEFLVADLLLKYLIQEINRMADPGENPLNAPKCFSKKYSTMLMHTQLCKEVEIIQMMSEWKEHLIVSHFKGERLDFDIRFGEFFDKQLSEIDQTVMIPDIWTEKVYKVTEKDEEKKEMSPLQHCATYLLNLFTLKTITNGNQICEIGLESWKYVSQFWKMNIPEAVILKIAAIFRVWRKEDTVCVKKGSAIKEVGEKTRQEEQRDIAHFLQDEVSYHLCMLHDDRLPNYKKQASRETVLRIKFDIDFEVVLGEIKKFVQSGKWSRGSLEKNIISGCRILETDTIDSSMVLDWLMYINLLAEKNRFRIQKHRLVEKLSGIIFEVYEEEADVVYAFLRVAKNIMPDRTIQRRFESNQLIHWLYEQPRLFLDYVRTTKEFVLNEEMAYSFFGSFQSIFNNDMESAMELLELFYGLGIGPDPDVYSVLEWLWFSKEEICVKSPKTLIKFFVFLIRVNQKDRVEEFFRKNESLIIKMLRKNLGISADVLEVVLKMHMERDYTQGVCLCIQNNLQQIISEFPEVAIRLMKVINATNAFVSCFEITRGMLRLYENLFQLAPKEAVLLLRMLRDSDGDYNKYFDAVQYAIVNFGVLLGDSVDAAIKLIYLCKNMSLFRKTNHIIACVKRCFEYIIFNDVGFDMGIMIGLLKKLDSKELGELKDYFDKRLIYINDKYPGLAKKIEELS